MNYWIRKIVTSQRGGTTLVLATAFGILAAAVVALVVAVGGTTSGTATAGAEQPWTCGDLKLQQATYVYPLTEGKSYFKVDGVLQAVTLSNVSGKSFDWSSTLGMDAALVKTWFTTNAYTYDEAHKDNGLAAYKDMEIKFVVFCFDPDKKVVTEEPVDEKCTDRKGCEEVTPELVTPETEKCTDRKGCDEVTPELITPETEKCTNRKGCEEVTPEEVVTPEPEKCTNRRGC